MGEGVPITNTLFPPPPGYYKAFTAQNVARLAALRAQTSTADGDVDLDSNSAGPSTAPGKDKDGKPLAGVDAEALAAPAQAGEMDKLVAELSPPRADGVLEDGRWMLFGQMYTAEPHIANAKEIGLPALVSDPVSAGGDSERAALPTLLHSFLHTLLALVDVLTGTARIPGELEMTGRASEGDQYVQHLSNLAATMMVSANQLRGVQAEATLVMLMEKQLEERRAQTSRLKEKCAEISATIRRLKAASLVEAGAGASKPADVEAPGDSAPAAEGEEKGADEAMVVDSLEA